MGHAALALFLLGCGPEVFAQSVPFYRTLSANFPSGHSAPEKLQRSTSEIAVEHWVHILKKDDTDGWIRRRDILSEMNFVQEATLEAGAEIRTQPQWTRHPTRQATQPTTVKILDLDIPWAQIQDGSQRRWVEVRHLKPLPSDLGVFMAKNTLRLYRKPSASSAALGYVPAGTLIRPVRTAGQWVRTRLGGQTGFIHLRDVVSRFDFAISVRGEDGQWSRVEGLTDGRLNLKDNRTMNLDEVREVRGDPFRLLTGARAVSISDHPSRHARLKGDIEAFTPFLRIGETSLRWGKSLVRNHGWVWWPMELRQVKSDGKEELPAMAVDRLLQPDRELLESSRLFKRKIFDVVTSPLFPRLSFASAGGIFRTLDGETWERLKEFRESNLPLAIAENGTVFIGPYLSKNHGESFTPFIPWEKILNGITQVTGKYPLRLNLLDVHPEDRLGHKVRIRVDPGFGRPILLKTTDQGKTWFIAPPRKP